MERSKELTDSEKKSIIKELAKSTTVEDIARQINRHVVTVKRFINNSLRKRKTRADYRFMKSVSKRDFRCLKRNLRKQPEATSAAIFIKKQVYQTLLKVHKTEFWQRWLKTNVH